MKFLLMLSMASVLALPGHSATYNVMDPPFNAKGNDIDDDRVSIQAALNAANANPTGGTVFLPAGIYRVNCTGGTNGYGLLIGSRTKLVGEGAGVSYIKAYPLQSAATANGCRIIANMLQNSSGDSYITLEDFTVNGDALQQPNVSFMAGINFEKVTNATLSRIVSKNVKGTEDGNNGAAFNISKSSHISFTDCEAASTSFNPATKSYPVTGSGFVVSNSTGIEMKGCRASGSTRASGFVTYGSTLISYLNCHAYENAADGFKTMVSKNILFANCLAGGITPITPNPAYIPYPYPSSSSKIGNNKAGFTVVSDTNVMITNCISEYNGVYGIYVTTSNGVKNSGVRIQGGVFTGNGGGGPNDGQIFFQYHSDAQATRITGGPVFGSVPRQMCAFNNLKNEWYAFNGSGALTPRNAKPDITIPQSGKEVENPYPFDILVNVKGTISVLLVDSISRVLPTTGGTFKVPVGSNFKLTYSGAFSWSWMVAD